MTDLSPLPRAPLGRYRHYKGKKYEMFFEEVAVGGRRQPCFARIVD